MRPISSEADLLRSAGRYPRPFSTRSSISSLALALSVPIWSSGLMTSMSAGGTMSAAVTSPGPVARRNIVAGSLVSERSRSSLMLRMMSVTSSLTPGMLENSCRTPSIFIDVTAAPGMDDSSVRRSELPSVYPKPGSSGSITNRERVSLRGCVSIRGREISMCFFTSGSQARYLTWVGHIRLPRVQLHDQLLLDADLDLVAGGQAQDRGPGLSGVPVEPVRRRPAGLELDRLVDVQIAAHGLFDLHDVARLDGVGRDVHDAAVDRHVAVADQLAGLVARAAEPGAVDDVVEARLQELEQHLAGDALAPRGLLVVAVELLLEHPVDAPRLLLLAELQQVLGFLGPATAVLAGRVGAALDRALGALALGALEEELGLLPPAELAVRTCVACQLDSSLSSRGPASHPTALGGTAAVVGDRGDVLDPLDLEAGGLERPDRRFAAGAGPLHEDVHLADAVLLGPARRLLGSELGRERGRLARALEADVARRRPGDRVPLRVRDGHDRVVEARLDVGVGVRDVLLLATPRLLGPSLALRHRLPASYFLVAFFLPATVFFGPLRVRALVWVR